MPILDLSTSLYISSLRRFSVVILMSSLSVLFACARFIILIYSLSTTSISIGFFVPGLSN